MKRKEPRWLQESNNNGKECLSREEHAQLCSGQGRRRGRGRQDRRLIPTGLLATGIEAAVALPAALRPFHARAGLLPLPRGWLHMPLALGRCHAGAWGLVLLPQGRRRPCRRTTLALGCRWPSGRAARLCVASCLRSSRPTIASCLLLCQLAAACRCLCWCCPSGRAGSLMRISLLQCRKCPMLKTNTTSGQASERATKQSKKQASSAVQQKVCKHVVLTPSQPASPPHS